MYSIGQRVMAQWTDGQWYPGKVVQVEGPNFNVVFDDGANSWVQAHQIQVQGGSPMNQGMGAGGGFQQGSRIRRLWTDGNWYEGKIDQIAGDDIHVIFDDGDDAWLKTHEVELVGGAGMSQGGVGMSKGGMGMSKGDMGMSKGGMGGGYSPGQRVKAQWSDGQFYGATITNVTGPDSYFVTFDDGYTATVQGHQIQGEPGMGKGGMGGMGGMGAFTLGQRVKAVWGGSWYPAKITEIGGDGRYHVTFDDGYTSWLTPDQIQG